MDEGEKGEPARLPPCPPKRKGANTTNKELLKEYVTILWNYVIEVQDLVAELMAVIDETGTTPDSIAAQLRAGQTPAQILDDMIAKAKGDPIRAGL